jgi:hypothetical protein
VVRNFFFYEIIKENKVMKFPIVQFVHFLRDCHYSAIFSCFILLSTSWRNKKIRFFFPPFYYCVLDTISHCSNFIFYSPLYIDKGTLKRNENRSRWWCWCRRRRNEIVFLAPYKWNTEWKRETCHILYKLIYQIVIILSLILSLSRSISIVAS